MSQVKSADVLAQEKTSHRTKEELAGRKKAEESLKTGEKMIESDAVKQNSIAHDTFVRITENLSLIGENDALYENSINRYCLIASDISDLREEKALLMAQRDEMGMDFPKECRTRIDTIEKLIQSYRRMMLEIEKENLLTVQSASRQVPKKAKSEERPNPLMEALYGDYDA